MLAQFQSRYPTGSLNSELLTIYQGKFIVRVSVQVEGITRATGMAAAETVELAEDRARSRALMVLGIQPETLTLPNLPLPDSTNERQTQLAETISSAFPTWQTQNLPPTSTESKDSGYGFLPSSLVEASTPAPLETSDRSWNPPPIATPQPVVENLGIPHPQSDSEEMSISLGNVTPLFPGDRSPESSTSTMEEIGDRIEPTDEPMDRADAIARTTEELKRLNWSNKRGRDYLEQTYSKRSRQQLNDTEMLEFLHYLESQPAPVGE